jgi:predicted porin
MKKSLIALAVLAASGAAMAQSSVTIYGIADVWVGRTSETSDVGIKTSTTKLESGGLNGSRLGFKGTEDLGGGLKAVFALEQGIALDTGAGGSFNRQSYVGLAGGFGQVTFGNTWTAMDDILGASNSGFDSALSASNNVLAVNALYESNPGNTIKYVSPSFGGFSGGFSHSLDEVSGVKADVTDFSLSYAAGPVAANFAYQLQNDVVDLKLTALNGSYDLGMAKLLASFGQAKAGALKATDYQIGVDVPLSSAMTLSAGYAQSKDNAAAGDEKRTGFGVAVGYSLSKRTTTYAGYRQAKVKNSSEKDSVIAAGIRHTF